MSRTQKSTITLFICLSIGVADLGALTPHYPEFPYFADSLERALPRPVPFQPSGRLDERYQRPLVLQWRIPHDFSALPAWPQLESDALGARGQHRHAALAAETDRTRARGHNAPGDCFSCSVVVDSANTAGFKTGTEDEFVAVYTATKQGTCLAYSNDKGATWQGYAGNPGLLLRQVNK